MNDGLSVKWNPNARIPIVALPAVTAASARAIPRTPDLGSATTVTSSERAPNALAISKSTPIEKLDAMPSVTDPAKAPEESTTRGNVVGRREPSRYAPARTDMNPVTKEVRLYPVIELEVRSW